MTRPLLLLPVLAALLTGCGQTGRLYLPNATDGDAGEIITRPGPPPEDAGGSANSPQTVDSPAQAPPAPEVTEPEARVPEEDDDDRANKRPESPQKN